MVECLAENCQIDGVIRDGRFFKVADTILQIRESMILGELGSNFDHALGNIDGDDLSSAFWLEFGRAFLHRRPGLRHQLEESWSGRDAPALARICPGNNFVRICRQAY